MSPACVAGLIGMHCGNLAAAVHHPTQKKALNIVVHCENHGTSVRAVDLPSIIFEGMKIAWILGCLGDGGGPQSMRSDPFSEALWLVALLVWRRRPWMQPRLASC